MVSDSARQEVRERAGAVCEYCRMPEHLSSASFHVDHIIATSHEGDDDVSNYAWSCILCNLAKGPNVGSFDGESSTFVRLFNPRADSWEEHFEWRGAMIVGKTEIGRVTVSVLQMNKPKRIETRRILIELGRFFNEHG